MSSLSRVVGAVVVTSLALTLMTASSASAQDNLDRATREAVTAGAQPTIRGYVRTPAAAPKSVTSTVAGKKDLALQQEVARGTATRLRVIVRTRPDPRALNRIAQQLATMMAETGVTGTPRVHGPLFAIAAQVRRDRLAQLEADPDVLHISTDAVVRSASLSPTDAAWVDLVARRDALKRQLDTATQAVYDDYNPRIDNMSAQAVARRQQTEAAARQRIETANLRLAERQAAADARAAINPVRRAEREQAANARLAAATTRKAERTAAADARKTNAANQSIARQAAASARGAAATNARTQVETNAAAAKTAATNARKAAVAAAAARKTQAALLAWISTDHYFPKPWRDRQAHCTS